VLLGLVLGSVLLEGSPVYPRPPQASLDRLLREARDSQNRGDLLGAVQKYREASKLAPTAEIYEKLGLASFLGNAYPQAVDAFLEALRMEPRRWVSQLFLGESLYKLNRFQEALPHVANALRLRPDQNEARYWLGCVDHALGNFDQAIVRLTEASGKDPQNVDILYALTETYLDYSTVLLDHLGPETPSRERRMVVDQRIREVASNALVDADSWKNTMVQLRTIGDSYAAASKSLQPDPEALFALSRIYGQMGQLMAEKVWKLKPDSYRSHELLGQSYENQKDYEMALTEYRKALQIDPSAPGLNYAVGHAYWEMKQLSQAIPALEKELALNPYHPSANYVLGHIYLRVDSPHPEKAAFYLERAVEAKPDFVEARKQLGRALSLMHENQKAVEQLELAAKEDPHDDTVHYLLASIYRKMGLEDKARKELEMFDQLRAEKHISDATPK
jgi:tetratricopeptide (TPR) repeat protein